MLSRCRTLHGKRSLKSRITLSSVRKLTGTARELFLVRPADCGSEGSQISYIPNFLDYDTASSVFDYLRRSVDWKREVDDFGPQDRKSFFWADQGCTFAYVGLKLTPNPWPSALLAVKHKLNAHFSSSGVPVLTACLGNNYEEGQGSIVWHCDEVRAHGPNPLIVSLSLSPDGPRDFKVKHKSTEKEFSQKLEHGSLLVMSGTCQQHWLHSLPLEKDAPHRISLTFRSIVPGFEDAQHDNGRMEDCVQ